MSSFNLWLYDRSRSLWKAWCFLKGLRHFWIRRQYEKQFQEYWQWRIARDCTPVTERELIEGGFIYSAHVGLEITAANEGQASYRAWLKGKLAEMKAEMADYDCIMQRFRQREERAKGRKKCPTCGNTEVFLTFTPLEGSSLKARCQRCVDWSEIKPVKNVSQEYLDLVDEEQRRLIK